MNGNEASMLRRPYFTDETFNNDFSRPRTGRPSRGVRIDPQEYAQVNACIVVCYHVVNVRQVYEGFKFRVHIHRHSSLNVDYELFTSNVNASCNNISEITFYEYDSDAVNTKVMDIQRVSEPTDHIDIHVYLPVVSYQYHTLSWPPLDVIENQVAHHDEHGGDRLIVAMPFDVREIVLESMTSYYNVMPLIGICPYNNMAFKISYGDTPRIAVPNYGYPLLSRYNSLINKVLYSKNRAGYCRACCLLSLYKSGDVAPLFTSPK